VRLILDTSIIIPYLGDVAYARLLWPYLVREQVLISAVSALELLAGSLTREQRQKALHFVGEFERSGRLVLPAQEDWLRAGTILARFQNLFGHVVPADHQNDLLILLAGQRLGGSVATENGSDFRTWSRFLRSPRRPPLLILNRQEHLNRG
jgi:predicted nucleic acid-binding protein